MKPGTPVLPFAIPQDVWDDLELDDTITIYGDGKVKDEEGDDIPGNWGTVDLGPSNNSTADLRDQIVDGLRQSDLDALYDDGRIPSSTHLDSTQPFWVNADPGLSSGINRQWRTSMDKTAWLRFTTPRTDKAATTLNTTWSSGESVHVLDSHWNGRKTPTSK